MHRAEFRVHFFCSAAIIYKEEHICVTSKEVVMANGLYFHDILGTLEINYADENDCLLRSKCQLLIEQKQVHGRTHWPNPENSAGN